MNKVDLTSLTNFDALPSSAHVRLPVVCALFGVSAATVWRWCQEGRLPEPVRMGGVTLWNVGALRACLPLTGASRSPPLADPAS